MSTVENAGPQNVIVPVTWNDADREAGVDHWIATASFWHKAATEAWRNLDSARADVTRLTADRSTDFDAKAALEQELALKDAAIEQLRTLAQSWWASPDVVEDPGEPILHILDALAARIEAANKDYDEKEREQ